MRQQLVWRIVMDLQKLKQKLVNDKELAPVYVFFFDHFADDPLFTALGDMLEHSDLEATVGQIAEQMYPGSGHINEVRLARLADEKFIHGAFHYGNRLGMVFYFEDCLTGLVAIPEGRPSIEVKYARFRLKRQGPDPSLN
jgi:hypothetical protein